MVVLPATRKVVLSDLREELCIEHPTPATEDEFRTRFPDCEPGAMPPFGNLYGMDVLVAPSLATEETIAFNAGTHTEVIQMAYADFDRLLTRPWAGLPEDAWSLPSPGVVHPSAWVVIHPKVVCFTT